jgi:homoserine dehydrogenase
MKEINIGLVGFGTIGSGVYDLLHKNGGLIRERTGINLTIKTICDLRIDDIKKSVSGIELTQRWEDIIEDESIDIVIELIGGIEPAKTIILKALESGKSAVTANKKLLAEEGKEIFKAESSSRGSLKFEASVAGGIPCILALQTGLVGNRILSITGILNGTTNYILTKMKDEGLPFDQVLKAAQEKGFAEADPTFDIEGQDAGHKIALLAMLSYGKNVDFSSLSIEGITRISSFDISFADEMGYIIKLLGIAKMVEGKLDIRVHPTMISKTHPLASVRNEYNAVMFDCDMTDPVLLYGKGAGSHPTASAVVSDLVQIAGEKGKSMGSVKIREAAEFLPSRERLSRYYVRAHTEDRPGILSKISGIFGKHNISIASVIQKEVSADYVPLIIMTHLAQEENMLSAIDEIGDFDFVDGDVVLIRVEDSLHGEEPDEQ